jgi:hypothetical protein
VSPTSVSVLSHKGHVFPASWLKLLGYLLLGICTFVFSPHSWLSSPVIQYFPFVLSHGVISSHMWLFKFKLDLKFSFLFAQVTIQVHSSHVCIVAAMLGRTNNEYFHYQSKFYWLIKLLKIILPSLTLSHVSLLFSIESLIVKCTHLEMSPQHPSTTR